MHHKVAVLTPTYNREATLKKLYNSLLRQTSKNFVWYVVDDGSKDHTQELVAGMIAEKKIPIIYLYKENGGKHTALNLGIQRITEELTFVVDSDDYLTDNAIESIQTAWKTYEGVELCGVSFLKGFDEDTCVGQAYPQEGIYNYVTMRLKWRVAGDKAECFRTDLLKKYPFPEIENERFLGEDYVWIRLAQEHSMAWINKIIYICEYLEGGLSKSGKKLRIRCSIGGMLNSAVFLTKGIPLRTKLKKAVLYNCYHCFALKQKKKKELKAIDINRSFWVILTMPVGWALYLYWNKKYGN